MTKTNRNEAEKEWFGSWFDTPYYHSLYANRDDEEAAFFLNNLMKTLEPDGKAKVLDAACGKGRHSVYLHDKGFEVTGFDLSRQSIEEAQKQEKPGLHFDVRDIRQLDYQAEFDLVLNLFTSFGYFDTEEEDQQVVSGFAKALKPGGILVMDYLNPSWVKSTLVEQEKKLTDGITFNIEREIANGWVKKHIRFQEGKDYLEFTEQVKLLETQDFQTLFKKAGLDYMNTYGNYALDAYQAAKSPRQILVAKKIA